MVDLTDSTVDTSVAQGEVENIASGHGLVVVSTTDVFITSAPSHEPSSTPLTSTPTATPTITGKFHYKLLHRSEWNSFCLCEKCIFKHYPVIAAWFGKISA